MILIWEIRIWLEFNIRALKTAYLRLAWIYKNNCFKNPLFMHDNECIVTQKHWFLKNCILLKVF